MLRLVGILCLVVLSLTARSTGNGAGTHYWVSLTGSDANSCAAVSGDVDPGVYKLTPQSGASCLTVAGARLTIKAGLYTGAGARIFEPSITVTNGTVGNPTIIEGVYTAGCAISHTCGTILRPTSTSTNLESASFITMRGIEINGINNTNSDACIRLGGTGAGVGGNIIFEDLDVHHCGDPGVFIKPGYDTITLTRVSLHHNGLVGNFEGHGCYCSGDNTTIQYSELYENGGTVANNSYGVQFFSDELSPLDQSSNAIVRYSSIHHNRGGGIAVDGTGALIHDTLVYNNQDDGIDLGYSGAQNSVLYNNGVYNNGATGIYVGIFANANNSTLINNHVIGNAVQLNTSGSTGLTLTTNRITGSITDCLVSTSNFVQKVGSLCSDAGTIVPTRLTFNGAAPDIGPFETFGIASASITENILDVTHDLMVFMPVLPSTGQTGWSLNNARTVTNAEALSATVTRLTFNGAVCTPSETWTVSYTPGNVTDSALIGYSWMQPLFAVTAHAVTNACLSGQPQDPSLTGPRRNPFLFR